MQLLRGGVLDVTLAGRGGVEGDEAPQPNSLLLLLLSACCLRRGAGYTTPPMPSCQEGRVLWGSENQKKPSLRQAAFILSWQQERN